MANQKHVTCPSGLAGIVRGMKLSEVNALTDAAGLRKNTTFDALLTACWLETQDAGPYALGADGQPDWGKVLVADRFATMVKIRVATYGPAFEFRVQCTNGACRDKFAWALDLESDLEIRPIPGTALDAFRNGNRFETRMGDGRRLWFKLMVGDDERKAAGMAGRQRTLTASLAARIVEIEGVQANDRLRAINDIDLADAADLISKCEEADGGVETDYEVECPACGSTQRVALPFFGREFLMPMKRRG